MVAVREEKPEKKSEGEEKKEKVATYAELHLSKLFQSGSH